MPQTITEMSLFNFNYFYLKLIKFSESWLRMFVVYHKCLICSYEALIVSKCVGLCFQVSISLSILRPPTVLSLSITFKEPRETSVAQKGWEETVPVEEAAALVHREVLPQTKAVE